MPTIGQLGRHIAVPIVTALIATAAFNEWFASALTILTKSEPDWLAATAQASETPPHAQELFFDAWKLDTKLGRANAVIFKDKDPNKKWIATGSFKNGVIAMGYAAERAEHKGIGTIYLSQVGSSDEYRGVQIAYDCDTKKLVVCPYLIVPNAAKALLNDVDHRNFLAQSCKAEPAVPAPASCSGTSQAPQATPAQAASPAPSSP